MLYLLHISILLYLTRARQIF